MAAAEQHDKEIYGEKVRKLLLEKTNLDSLKDVLHDYDIIVKPKKRATTSKANGKSVDKATNDTGVKTLATESEEPIESEDWVDDADDDEDDDDDYEYTDVDFGLGSGN